jgi:hypothetical protein
MTVMMKMTVKMKLNAVDSGKMETELKRKFLQKEMLPSIL